MVDSFIFLRGDKKNIKQTKIRGCKQKTIHGFTNGKNWGGLKGWKTMEVIIFNIFQFGSTKHTWGPPKIRQPGPVLGPVPEKNGGNSDLLGQPGDSEPVFMGGTMGGKYGFLAKHIFPRSGCVYMKTRKEFQLRPNKQSGWSLGWFILKDSLLTTNGQSLVGLDSLGQGTIDEKQIEFTNQLWFSWKHLGIARISIY